jgi:hypothetical protein
MSSVSDSVGAAVSCGLGVPVVDAEGGGADAGALDAGARDSGAIEAGTVVGLHAVRLTTTQAEAASAYRS